MGEWGSVVYRGAGTQVDTAMEKGGGEKDHDDEKPRGALRETTTRCVSLPPTDLRAVNWDLSVSSASIFRLCFSWLICTRAMRALVSRRRAASAMEKTRLLWPRSRAVENDSFCSLFVGVVG